MRVSRVQKGSRRVKSYIPCIRSDKKSLLEAEDGLCTQPLRLVEVGEFAPSFRVSGNGIEELNESRDCIGRPVERA